MGHRQLFGRALGDGSSDYVSLSENMEKSRFYYADAAAAAAVKAQMDTQQVKDEELRDLADERKPGAPVRHRLAADVTLEGRIAKRLPTKGLRVVGPGVEGPATPSDSVPLPPTC